MTINLAQQITAVNQSRETKAILKKFLKSNKITLTSFVETYNTRFAPVGYTSFHYKANKNGMFSEVECRNVNALITDTLKSAQ